MEWSAVLLLAVAVLVVLLITGMRVYAALYLVGAIIIALLIGVKQIELFGMLTWTTWNSLAMASLPLFIFMGVLFSETKIGERIYAAMYPLVDRIPGGLLQANVIVATFFGAATGSSFASAATIGAVSLPEMEKRGYSSGISLGSCAAGGAVGVIIPPSIVMIVYALLVDQSIGKLYIAGIFPGLLVSALYMLYIGIRVKTKPELAPRGATFVPLGASILSFFKGWPIFVLIILVIGSIYAGIATPTEAAAVGVFGVVVLALVFRELSWSRVKVAAASTVRTTCMMMLLVAGAKTMGILLANTGILHKLAQWVIALPVPPVGIFFAIVILYLIMGMFISGLPSIVITLPITYPIIVALGYDPIWFLLIIVLLSECGALSPPVGLLLYLVRGLRPQVPVGEVMRGVMPFFFCILAAVIIITIFPQIATWLPATMIKR